MRVRTIIVAVAMFSFLGSFASAKQYVANYHGRSVVVHTSPIPVIMHRMVPPQHGKHVTLKEVQSGRVPSPQPIISGR